MTNSIVRSKKGYTALGFALVFWLSAQIGFSAEPSFYSGKTVNIIAGFAPGGTIDIRARLFHDICRSISPAIQTLWFRTRWAQAGSWRPTTSSAWPNRTA